MRIDRLNLIGFGKFQNKKIELKDGINIIYAKNEGGKTTIHRFIDGMFYGFLKPYVKSIIYLADHKKYEPWAGSSYKGLLNLEVNQKKYRIERNFTKGMEDTKVFLEDTGVDITSSINSGSRARIPQPGYEFFGFNSGIYSNTVSISQLGVVTEEKLANEVRDKLVNITSSLDEKISVERAIKDLDKRIKDIGNDKATSSPYGIISIDITNLKNRRSSILIKQEEYEGLLEEKERLDTKLNVLNKTLEGVMSQEKVVEYLKKKSIYTEAIKEIENIRSLKSKLDKYKDFKDLSSEDYSVGQEISHDIKIINSRIDDTKSRLTEIKEAMHHLFAKKTIFNEIKAKDLFDDYFDYDNINEEIIRLEGANKDKALDFLERDIKDIKSSFNRRIVFIILLFSIYLISMYLTWSNQSVIILLQSFWILLALNIRKIIAIKKSLSSILQGIKEIEKEEDTRQEELKSIEISANEILIRNSCKDKSELRDKYQKTLEDKYKFEEEQKSIEANKTSISTLNNRIQELNLKKQAMEDELKGILIKNHTENLEELKLGLNYKNIYEDLSIEYRNRQEILTKILGTNKLDDLKEELDKNIHLDIEAELSEEALEISLEEIKQSISECSLEVKKLETQIHGLTPEISSLVNIEEEIMRKLKLIDTMDEKRQSLDLAKSTIMNLSKEIHTQFAPHINERVGNVLGQITGDRYKTVKIDHKLNMGVIDPITGEIININSLSGGTIDQLYFSLRFGIINSITDKNLPLILDDPFIQYDDERLKNILKLLKNIGQQRQIILFTCQKREINFLKDMDIDLNLITLS